MPKDMHAYAVWVHCLRLRLRLLERFCIMGAWALEGYMDMDRWVKVTDTRGKEGRGQKRIWTLGSCYDEMSMVHVSRNANEESMGWEGSQYT